MNCVQDSYREWLAHASGAERDQLEELAGDDKALEDAFFQELSFGTAGLRGIIGAGPNRMNVRTVGKATQGLADYLNANFDEPSVAIARDSRNKGLEFVCTAACVLAANGVHARVYKQVAPTPALSFAVRHLGCSAGINVTASHNPAPYNGYKVYGADGCQIASSAAAEIQEAINALDVFNDVKSMDYDDAVGSGLISDIDDEVLDAFVDAVAAQSVEPLDAESDTSLSVVYTPLNGTGLYCVERILDRIGVTDVHVVAEQAHPDGDFPTCPYPNPETAAALERGLALARQVNPDLLIATDPDADRVGIAVRHDGEYELLTGNEVGILLIDYLCAQHRLMGHDLSDKVVISTIVSTAMTEAQAREEGFELRRVLTGFKYIGGQIALLEQDGQADRFMFGFEESYGYMSGPHVRDKDAINAVMLIAQMARWHKSAGRDLVEALAALYERYGFYMNRTVSIEYPGADGSRTMARIMRSLRENPPSQLAGFEVASFVDFADGADMPIIGGKHPQAQRLPGADVVSFELGEGVKVLVRPSGTEPKIKVYLFACADSKKGAEEMLDALEASARALL